MDSNKEDIRVIVDIESKNRNREYPSAMKLRKSPFRGLGQKKKQRIETEKRY